MKRIVRVQLSVLAGVFGFFLGGILNSGREIIDVMMGAAIGWAILFFIAFFFLEYFYFDITEKKSEIEIEKKMFSVKNTSKNVGKKIDITLKNEDNFDDIYKTK